MARNNRPLSMTPAAIRQRLSRANATGERAAQRNTAERQRHRTRNNTETLEQRVLRLELNRTRRLARISLETPEQRQQRQDLNRIQTQNRRAAQKLNIANAARVRRNARTIPEESVDEFSCGPMEFRCQYCQSKNFKGEMAADKKFTNCCEKGKIELRILRTHKLITKLMKEEHPQSKNFMENISSKTVHWHLHPWERK